MRPPRYPLLLFLSPFLTDNAAADPFTPSPDANHIFNAIHNSMRQWGSSLHHNGMSFFMTSVPAGTQFYHGNSRPGDVTGPEWLAFEPEHAMVFARPRHHGHPPPPPPGSGVGSDGGQMPLMPPPPPGSEPDLPVDKDTDTKGEEEEKAGYLHTFTTSRDLRLLYLDGMSAAKTTNGTLDSQDRVLFRDELGDGPGMQEKERAELLCQMAREDWDGGLDGVIRMEAGFEVILCDFDVVDVVRVTRVKASEDGGKRGMGKKMFDGPGGKRDGKGKGNGGLGGAELWFKAIATRYNGIGGHRVRVDFDRFVTAYDDKYGVDLFPAETKNQLPRLHHLSNEQLEPIRADLDDLIRSHQMNKAEFFDWQAIADMVVLRYGHELRYMASGQAGTLKELHREIESLLGPFIDYDEEGRDSRQETERCATQFIPAGAPDGGIAGEAVRSVSNSICSTLVEAWHNHTDYEAAIEQLRQLMEYLNWTMWKECRGCDDHEICVVPIWPMGTVEDYEHPQCRDASRPSGEGSRYWGEPPGRGPKPSGPDPSLPSPFSSWFHRLKYAFYG